MHSVSFQLKRAHLQAVAFGRQAVRKVKNMTPARFDLLYALRQVNLGVSPLFGFRTFGLTQCDLTRTLGLSRATVSKMLKRLEQLGWVSRVRASDDRRKKYVKLTEEGLRRIWRAMRRVFRGRILLRSYEVLFSQIKPEKQHVLVAIESGWLTIDSIARHFGDISTLSYDFGVELD
jgi:DNA-binding MarR family transcriptional regulator